MTRAIPADKKSCRKLHDKGMLSEDDMCPHCSELHSTNYGSSFLFNNKHLWQNKCHRTNQPPGNSDQASNTISTNRNMTPATRNRSAPERFIGSPGGGKKMNNQMIEQGRHFAAQKRKRTALKLIATPSSNDNEIDRAVAQRLASMSNGNKENVPIEMPRGGTSRSAIYKSRRQGGLLLTGLANMWSKRGAKIAPEIIREEFRTPSAPSGELTEAPPLCRASINFPEDFDAPVRKSKRRRLTDPLRQEMGAQVISRIQQSKKTDQSRPILAAFASYPRKTLEKVTGVRLSNREFSNIRTHAQYPGPWEPVEKAEIFRNRLSTSTILAFLHLLGDPNSLQRLAFGQKCVEVLGGRSFVTIDRVETSIPIRTIAARFVVSLFDEASAVLEGESIPESHLRCQKIERDSFRRCLSCRNHTGNCRFTSKDGCSMTTARKVVSILSGGELKSLSGLDDIKVVQGRENFIRMRSLIDKLAEPEESATMKKQVDDVELFYKTDFQNHLEREGEHACCCLTCGFFDKSKFPGHWLIVTLCSFF
jgi:hypothetical protein